jgi:hypothetical protein
MPVKEVHQTNAPLPMEVTLSGITTLVREVHQTNAELPMLVTLFGMTTLAREVQFLNAELPIEVILFGITTSVREVQLENATSPMFVTPEANVTEKSVLPHLLSPTAESAVSTSASVTTPPVCPTTTATGTAAADGSADRGRRLVRMRKARVRVRSFLSLSIGSPPWIFIFTGQFQLISDMVSISPRRRASSALVMDSTSSGMGSSSGIKRTKTRYRVSRSISSTTSISV